MVLGYRRVNEKTLISLSCSVTLLKSTLNAIHKNAQHKPSLYHNEEKRRRLKSLKTILNSFVKLYKTALLLINIWKKSAKLDKEHAEKTGK